MIKTHYDRNQHWHPAGNMKQALTQDPINIGTVSDTTRIVTRVDQENTRTVTRAMSVSTHLGEGIPTPDTNFLRKSTKQ